MELIPILSLIILVATISTFILAVGAYILYKIRESKGLTAEAPQPSAIPAELVTPAPMAVEQRVVEPGRRTFAEQGPVPTFEQARAGGPELRPTFVTGERPYTQEQKYHTPGAPRPTSDAEKYVPQKKYLRYTNEGYEEPVKSKKSNEDNLRWR
ncbi:hypothetical protein ABRY23_01355 [Melioribacteraceae bacterium 4301-Me]|uniref:hypothetical protein n=1 Tax=Pyranulibacter aquaticus TaxID=3163344 RepID=UPI0035952287